MNRNWTDKEIELLATLSLTDRQISDMLGRSLASVTKKRQRINLPKKPGKRPKGDKNEQV